MPRFLALLLAVVALAVGASPAFADEKTDARLADSLGVFESFSNLTEQAIPAWLLERAYGLIVIPGVTRGAFIIGVRGGRGVMAVRDPDGTWSNPVFVTLAGANIGFQAGVQSTDLVLVLMSRKSVEGISGGKVTLGADASIAAGPMGRSAAAATSIPFQAQVLAYARNEGLFAGVALDGSVISIDDKANASAYGVSGILASQILEGRAGTPPAGAAAFRESLTRATAGKSAMPVSAGTAPATPAAKPAPPPDSPPAEPAKTFPLEDPAPGAPPPE